MLDIDGVLNRGRSHANGFCGIDADCVHALNSLLTRSGARIVIASAWRYLLIRGDMTLTGFNAMLHTHGVNLYSCVDWLPADEPGKGRAHLVREWFRARYGLHHRVRYVVIDDMDLGYTEAKMPFVWTERDRGLTLSHADMAYSHLQEPRRLS